MEDIYLLRGGGLNMLMLFNLFIWEGIYLKDVESNKLWYIIRFEGLEVRKKKWLFFEKKKIEKKKKEKIEL